MSVSNRAFIAAGMAYSPVRRRVIMRADAQTGKGDVGHAASVHEMRGETHSRRTLERIQFCCSGFEACIAASNAPADATAKLDLV